MTVDRLLNELEHADPEGCAVVELKFFLDLADEEAAEVLGLKLRTFQRKWREVRIWLFEKIQGGK